jgi:hypothetical protein
MNSPQTLVLHRRTRSPDQASLHCRELELRLCADGRHIMLSRYVELFSTADTSWSAVHHHRVPLTRMVRWLIDNGDKPKR